MIALDLPAVTEPQRELLTPKLSQIAQQIDRLKAITRRLMGITRYETKKYRNGKIIDIAKAAG